MAERSNLRWYSVGQVIRGRTMQQLEEAEDCGEDL